MMGAFGRVAMEVGAWGVAAVWCVRTSDLVRGLPTVTNLEEASPGPRSDASLVVVVPARDEEENIAATLEALLLQDLPGLRVVAVDDRSTDRTGYLMEEFVERFGGRLKVIHVSELPAGWLGKTNAMQLAVEASDTNWVLFTDADVLFAPAVLSKALTFAEAAAAAHVVVFPTVLVKSRGEGIVLGFFQVLGLWAARPWKVADAKSMRDAIGIGAFNMIRREALEEIGGLEPQRLTVLEDITLGRRVKAAGLRQRIAFAPGQVLVHWAKGAGGLAGVMTKNLFSGVNFRPALLLAGCLWIVVFCLAPVAGLGWWPTLLPSLLVLCCMAATYRTMGAVSRIDARYGWLYPLGAGMFVYIMLRSMVTAWAHGGVRWRGTHYPLKELRKHNSPLRWRKR